MMQLLMQAYPGGGGGGGGGGAEMIGGVIGLLFVLLIVAAILSIWGLIFKKAGYSFWLCLLMVIPLVNLIWLLIFALSTWPIHRELEHYRAQMGYSGSGFPVGHAPPGAPVPPPPPPMR